MLLQKFPSLVAVTITVVVTVSLICRGVQRRRGLLPLNFPVSSAAEMRAYLVDNRV
jgi:hypothetical protein